MNFFVLYHLDDHTTNFFKPIIHDMYQSNGFLCLVGGAPRDYFLKFTPHDYDIEVYGLSLDNVIKIISRYGIVSNIHTLYGTCTTVLSSITINWSIPRSDGSGSYPKVALNPFLSITEALMRRDLTINSIAVEIQADYSLVVHDPYHGIPDCTNLLAKATNIRLFPQDSMRFFRLLKYIGRYNLHVENELAQVALCMECNDFSITKKTKLINTILYDARYKSAAINFLQQSKLKDIVV